MLAIYERGRASDMQIGPHDVVEAQASDIGDVPGHDELGISLSHPTDRS